MTRKILDPEPVLAVDAGGTGTLTFDYAGRRWRAALTGWRTPLAVPPEPADGGPPADGRAGELAARHAHKLVNRYYRRGAA